MGGRNFAERGSVSHGKAGEFTGATVAYSENDDAGGKPIGVAPKSVSFGVETKVNSKIDMRNNRSAQIVWDLFEGCDLF